MDQFSLAFSYITAFMLPGLIGLYAVSFRSPVVRDWFGVAATQQTSVGGFLFAAAASLGVGLFLSGLRWFFIDGRFPPAPAFDSRLRMNADCEKVYQDIRLQHYVFYQFYANTFCALILLFVSWLTAPAAAPSSGDVIWSTAALGLVCVVLWKSAGDALTKHDRKMLSLSGAHCPPIASAASAGEALARPDVIG